MFQLTGQRASVPVTVGSVFLAMSVYVLHRFAPEINAAMQSRHLQAVRKRRTMLFVFGLVSIVSCGMLYMAEPYFVYLLPIGCIVVTLYGRKTVGYPIRNMLYVKPIAVGVSIIVYAWFVTNKEWPPLAAIGLTFVICSDALLCDIPDIAYDKLCGCTTIPAVQHELVIWAIGLTANAVTAVLLWLLLGSIVGWLMLMTLPFLFLFRKSALRTLVDLRLPFVVVLAWTI
ncbi:MAG: UbiA family prenyltransferase [Phycisphaerales bacterium]|nr:UbiA family prenyltransferase [Phycisphaerales bacterium]